MVPICSLSGPEYKLVKIGWMFTAFARRRPRTRPCSLQT